MIKLVWSETTELRDTQAKVQTAIDLEFATLPPYLYAKFSLGDEQNPAASALLDSIVAEEMIHMCLACNILNAIGGTVEINPPRYPGPLPGDVERDLTVHLLPFSVAAMEQGMKIEEPAEAVDPSVLEADSAVTIGEYYQRLDEALAALPTDAWTANRNQVSDSQFFQGQVFAVDSYADAHRAITEIVSEGEGTPVSPGSDGSPLDFEGNLAHYYRFWEISRNQQLVKSSDPTGYAWGGSLGVNWDACYPAIADPQAHDFSKDPPTARSAQAACNAAYTAMVDALTRAFRGDGAGELGLAVRAMFDLRAAASKALTAPLADGTSVAGPAFTYTGSVV